MDNKTQSVDPVKEFENIVNRFQVITADAKDISDKFYDKTNRFSAFGLETDHEKSQSIESPEGVISALNDMLNTMSYINRRNLEIFQHLNSII